VRTHPISILANRLVEFLDQWPMGQEHEKAAKEPEYLSPAEAAKRLRLNEQTLMKWCRTGEMQASKLGRKWLIRKTEIDRYLHRSQLINGKRKEGKA